jgi:hypothetical protein
MNAGYLAREAGIEVGLAAPANRRPGQGGRRRSLDEAPTGQEIISFGHNRM